MGFDLVEVAPEAPILETPLETAVALLSRLNPLPVETVIY
jgi:hypothetical protein